MWNNVTINQPVNLRSRSVTVFLTVFIVIIISDNLQAQNAWLQKADLTGGYRRFACGFAIGKKGYVGTGYYYDWLNGTSTIYKDFWEYNPENGAWTQKADFGGTAREAAVGFSIGEKGYMGTGEYFNDFWEYDPNTNSWVQKADYPAGYIGFAVGFSIGDKGYVGTGYDGGYHNDFWEYDAGNDSWTQKATLPAAGRYGAVGFTIGDKGYVGTGISESALEKDFWQYDPENDTWEQKADYGGGGSFYATGFSIDDKGYLGTGSTDFGIASQLWEYNPGSDAWIQQEDFGGGVRDAATGFSIQGKGYIGMGEVNGYGQQDFWEFDPSLIACITPDNLSSDNITGTTAKLTWNEITGAIGYKVFYKVAGTSAWTSTKTSNNFKKIVGLTPSTNYVWRVRSVCAIDPIIGSDLSNQAKFKTGLLRTDAESPEDISSQLYPNPAQDQTMLFFKITDLSRVFVSVYDLSGKEIAVLLDENLTAGDHSLQINTDHFAKGTYLLKIISDSGIQNQKLVVQ